MIPGSKYLSFFSLRTDSLRSCKSNKVTLLICVFQGILWHSPEDFHLHQRGGSKDEPWDSKFTWGGEFIIGCGGCRCKRGEVSATSLSIYSQKMLGLGLKICRYMTRYI